MVNLSRIIEQAGCNVPASEAAIRMCNMKLRQNKLPELPASFGEVLKICNGISNEGTVVFGAEIKNNSWFKDVAAFNIAYFKGQSADWLILGEDDFFFFIYDSVSRIYCVVDRDTMEEHVSGDDVQQVLECMLRIEVSE